LTDQPARSAESRHGRENTDLATWLNDQAKPDAVAESKSSAHERSEPPEPPEPETAEPSATYTEFHTPGYGTPVPSNSAPRPFSGFRSEQRFTDPTEWDAMTPPTGMRAVDPYAGGYYRATPAAAPPDGPPNYRPTVPPTPYPDLSTSALLRQIKPPPSDGWRRWLYVLSGKLINVGESPRANHHNNLVAQVNQPLQGCYRIALLSLKGGVGKTTITATLGATFASIRGDRVIAVDANPDRGTLSQKVPLETSATVRHLLRDAEGIQRYSDVRSYTSQGPSRLEVLASESDPAVSEAFSAEDYTRTLEVLDRFYTLVLTDCGTGLMHSAMSAVLAKTDTLIVISSGSVDGARSASATLDWLDAHGHQDLVRNSVAVINAVRPRSGKVDMQKVVDHFSRRCRAVRLVPFDPHLEEGAEVNLERLKRETREALIELAAVVADGFPGTKVNDTFR
jgi:MinD-like ATPase involved in chromosome partitioning or flagellar assembly